MNPLLNTPNGTTFNCIIFFVLTNRYGHPHEETMERLEDAGSKVFTTPECGAVTIEVAKKVKIYGFKN